MVRINPSKLYLIPLIFHEFVIFIVFVLRTPPSRWVRPLLVACSTIDKFLQAQYHITSSSSSHTSIHILIRSTLSKCNLSNWRRCRSWNGVHSTTSEITTFGIFPSFFPPTLLFLFKFEYF